MSTWGKNALANEKKMNTLQAKRISIIDYLALLGHLPVRTGAKGYWYHSMLSPNGDSTPSFEVSPDGRAFHDWSTGATGSIVDLAMGIMGMESVSSALQHLDHTMGGVAPAPVPSFSFHPQKTGIEILAVHELTSPALLAYASSRHIPTNLIQSYCCEVRFRNVVTSKEYFAIGWQNNAGGWELRNQYWKGAVSPKDITTINAQTDVTTLIFEGFFDYLSAVILGWFRPEEMNAIVLNSTAMIDHAIPVLGQAKRIICLLDNDAAGKQVTTIIRRTYPHAEDHSRLYASHKDLSEYLSANAHDE